MDEQASYDLEAGQFATLLREVFDTYAPAEAIAAFETVCQRNPHLSLALFDLLYGYLEESFYECYGKSVIMFDKYFEPVYTDKVDGENKEESR